MEGLANLINCPDEGRSTVDTCSLVVTPTSLSAPKEGGTYSLTVTAANNAGYAWVTNVSWIHVSALTYGSGTETVVVDANTACMTRTGTITVCGVTINVDQAAATVCCNVLVSPSSFYLDPCMPIANPLFIVVTLVDPPIPVASTDVSWLHLSEWIPTGPSQGNFEVFFDPRVCGTRVGHVFICNKIVTITQPFSTVFTPPTLTINGNNQTVDTVVSGVGYVGMPSTYPLAVTTLSGRSVGSGAFVHYGPNCSDGHLRVNINGDNTFYQPLMAIPPPDASCPIGDTLFFTVRACDGTTFVITQFPKGRMYAFYGTHHTTFQAPTPVTFTDASPVAVPLFDANYPDPSSATWNRPFAEGSSTPVTSWSITTQGGNSVTFGGNDPEPYPLSPAQLAELIAKMHQGTCMTHTIWAATVTVVGLAGQGPNFIVTVGPPVASIAP